MTAIVLDVAFVGLCCWYASILWLMLRDERAGALLALMGVVAFCAATHTAFIYDYPAGFYEDELKNLYKAWDGLWGDSPLFSPGEGLGVSMVFYSMIQGVLWQLVPGWWAIRLPTMVCGVMLPVGAYALARAMRFRVPGALCVAVAASVTPWALLYSRTSMGIAIVWHQVIVLWLVATTVWATEVPLRRWEIFTALSVGLGLALLIYDYFSGRTVLYMVAFLALLVPERRGKIILFAGLILGLLMYIPATFYPAEWTYRGFPGGGTEAPLYRWLPSFRDALWAFIQPIGEKGLKSLPMAAVMPAATFAACAGLLFQPWRRFAFVVVVFLWGILPVVVGGHVSTHRMICCYIAIALAAGAFIDRLPSRPVQVIAAIALSATIAWQGVSTFFHSSFWVDNGGWTITDCIQYQRSYRPVCYPAKH